MIHTPEPWEASALGGGLHANNVPICRFFDNCEGDYPNSEANARRIVACVNALKNVSTEWREAQNGIVCLGSPIKDRFLELEKQRDDLLKALEGAANYIDNLGGTGQKYRQAIAAVRGAV